MGAHGVSASLTAFSLRRRCRNVCCDGWGGKPRISSNFLSFYPLRFSYENHLPLQQGAAGKFLQTFITSTSGEVAQRKLWRRGLIRILSNLRQTPQSRTSRDSSPSMGAHGVSADLSAFSLRRRWAADCAAQMRWKAENSIKFSFFLSPPIFLRKSPPLATRQCH